jgi:hypothetical protein
MPPGASHPGAGTDKTKNWIDTPGPIIILVEPPLGENIGAGGSVAACRARSRATACGGLVF